MSDLSHHWDIKIVDYLPQIMPVLLEVLRSATQDLKTKLVAITAIGEMCMIAEEGFTPYIDSSMECLFNAAQMTLCNVQMMNTEEAETIYKLRK